MSRRHGQTRPSGDASAGVEGPTARVQAELEAERGRLRALLDSMIDPHVLLRPLRDQGAVSDLLVIDVNPAASGYADLPPEKLLGSTVRALVPDVYGALLVEALARVADTGSPIVRDGVTVLSSLFGGTQRSYDVRAARVGDDVSLTWRDVSERVVAAEALAQSEQRFRLLAENSTDVVFRGSPDSHVEWVSPSVAEVLGFEPAELVGRDSAELVAPDDRDRVQAFLRSDADRGVRAYQARYLTSDGGERWMTVTVRGVFDDDGEVVGYVGSARDTETEHRAVEEAQYLATHDELTHLLNRRAILARLDAIVQHPPRKGGRTAVLYLDLDGLKPVNDLFGHAAGDALLVEVARRLLSGVRSSDAVGRLGGDEFIVVLGGVHDTADAEAVASKLREAIREPIVVGDITTTTTASIGVAFLRPDDTTDTVMARADDALYDAKRAGKDQVQVDADDSGSGSGADSPAPSSGAADPPQPRAVLRKHDESMADDGRDADPDDEDPDAAEPSEDPGAER